VTWDETSRDAAEEAVTKLNTKRTRWLEMYAEGEITKVERDIRLADVEAQRRELESIRRIKSFTLRQGIDWTAAPSEVNSRLRELWRSVKLGPDMLPVEAVWIVTPEELEDQDAAIDRLVS
jgi:hypothetical protein